MEVELTKQREEHSQAQLLKQEVVKDVEASQEQLNGMTSSLRIHIITYKW